MVNWMSISWFYAHNHKLGEFILKNFDKLAASQPTAALHEIHSVLIGDFFPPQISGFFMVNLRILFCESRFGLFAE